MGWTEQFTQPANIEVFFEQQANFENANVKSRLLLAMKVGWQEAYAAVEYIHKDTNKREVYALTYMIRYYNNGHFGYKDMSEHCGPNICNCPEKILKLLTPLEKDGSNSNEWAQAWRDRCWANVNKRKKGRGLKVGTVVKFKEPIHFSNGYTRQELIVHSTKPLRFTDGDKNFFIIRRNALPDLIAE